MAMTAVYGALALATLMPAAALRLRERDDRDATFWASVALAIAGPAAWAAAQLWGAWHTGFAVSLWLTIAVTTVLFAGLSLATRQGWRLTPILVPYLVGLGVVALIWQRAPERPVAGTVPLAWFETHIVLALATYGLLTLAAVAGVAVFLQGARAQGQAPHGVDPAAAGRSGERAAAGGAPCGERARAGARSCQRHGGGIFRARQAAGVRP
jgi:ABC-type uncharacterized transport system permease subunit